MRVCIEMVIGANDGRVASRVAAAEPTFFQHGHIANDVLLRKVLRGCEAMTAAADDHDVVMLLGRRLAPCERPTVMTGERAADERENRITLHESKSSTIQK